MNDFYEKNKEYIKDVEIRPDRKICMYRRRRISSSSSSNTNTVEFDSESGHESVSGSGSGSELDIPHLLMIHGSCARMGQFEEQINGLQQHFHIVAFDRIGCGKSDKPKQYTAYSDENISQDLCTIFEKHLFFSNNPDGNDNANDNDEISSKFKKVPIFLMGHSYGCSEALRLAHRYQDTYNIVGVFLFGCANILSQQLPFLVRSVFSLPDSVLEWMTPSLSANFRASALHPDSENFEELQALESSMVNPVYMFKAFYQQLKFIELKNLNDLLTQNKNGAIPICMIHGKEDGIVPLEDFKKVYEHIEKILRKRFNGDQYLLEAHILDRCKHQVMQEKPQVCNEIVIEFWKKCITRTP